MGGRRHGRHGMGRGTGSQHEAGGLHDSGGWKGHCRHRGEGRHDSRVHVRRLQVDLRLLEEVKPAGDQGGSLCHRCRFGEGVARQQGGWGCSRRSNRCHWDGCWLSLPQRARRCCYRLWKWWLLLLGWLYQGFGHLADR